MAPEAVAGILNLRGRIVTVIDMRQMLHLPPRSADAPRGMAVGIEYNGEIFGLMIDAVGEVLRLDDGSVDQNPINLDAGWAGVSKGVYRLEGELMVILDVDRVLASQMPGAKAA